MIGRRQDVLKIIEERLGHKSIADENTDHLASTDPTMDKTASIKRQPLFPKANKTTTDALSALEDSNELQSLF